jgi:hypothetical protein
MFLSLVHLIISLNISYPYLIKFHDFMDNSQEGMSIKWKVQLKPNMAWLYG